MSEATSGANGADCSAYRCAHAGYILFGFAAQLSWQISRFRIGDPDLCLRLFKSNRDAGLILFGAMVLDVVVRRAVG